LVLYVCVCLSVLYFSRVGQRLWMHFHEIFGPVCLSTRNSCLGIRVALDLDLNEMDLDLNKMGLFWSSTTAPPL